MAMIKLIVLLLIISSTFVDARPLRKRRQITAGYYASNTYPYSSSIYGASYPTSVYGYSSAYNYPYYGSGSMYGSGLGQYGGQYGQYGQYPYSSYGNYYGSSMQYPYGSNYNYQYPNLGSAYGSQYGAYGLYGNTGQYGYNRPWYRTSRNGRNDDVQGRSSGSQDGKGDAKA